MDFKTQYDKHDRVYTKSGEFIKPNLVPEIDKYGNVEIKSNGDIDLYAQIQSWRDECDINILMAKFTNGDKTALMQRAGAYLDLADIPDNFNDILNLTTKAGALFDSLPVEVKQQFGNNVNNFLANAKTEEFKEIMSQSPEDIRKEKVMKSKKFTENNIEASQTKYYKNPAVDLVVDQDEPIVEEDVVTKVRRKLNEQE